MKNTFLAISICLLLYGTASAQQRYRAQDPRAFYCYKVGDALAHGGDSCHQFLPDQTFSLVYPGPPATGQPNLIADISGVEDSSYAYVDGTLVASNAPAPTHDSCDSTTALGGGEIDRLVESADGTLRLKRFLVTQKCVNGHLKAQSRALN